MLYDVGIMMIKSLSDHSGFGISFVADIDKLIAPEVTSLRKSASPRIARRPALMRTLYSQDVVPEVTLRLTLKWVLKLKASKNGRRDEIGDDDDDTVAVSDIGVEVVVIVVGPSSHKGTESSPFLCFDGINVDADKFSFRLRLDDKVATVSGAGIH